MNVINVEIYSLLILVILGVDYYFKYKKSFNLNSKLFFLLLGSVSILSILNIIYISFDLSIFLQKAIIFMYYFLAIIPPLALSYYVMQNHFVMSFKIKKLLIVIYFCFYFILLLMAFFHYENTFFKADSLLNFSQLNIISIITLIPLLVLIFDYFYYSLTQNRITLKIFFVGIIPIVALICDLKLNTFTLLTVGYTISAIILYTCKYDQMINMDTLTNLYNRRFLDNYDENINVRKNLIATFMIDIDDFKKINDTYGHIKGDEILKDVSEILQRSVRKDDFVIRYGGDEFVILGEVESEKDGEIIEEKIESNLEEYNKTHKIKIHLSIGAGFYLRDEKNLIEVLENIDKKMYYKKLRKK